MKVALCTEITDLKSLVNYFLVNVLGFLFLAMNLFIATSWVDSTGFQFDLLQSLGLPLDEWFRQFLQIVHLGILLIVAGVILFPRIYADLRDGTVVEPEESL